MKPSRPYLKRLKQAVEALHQCQAKHLESAAVMEFFEGRPVWNGQVETFAMTGHPKAKVCYAWSYQTGQQNETENFVAVLQLPPVATPRDAVQAAIASQFRSKNS